VHGTAVKGKCSALQRSPGLSLSGFVLAAQVAATPVSSSSFVFKPSALAPGQSFRFALSATDAGGTASAEVLVATAGIPSGGSLLVTTPAGAGIPIAYATVFSLSASDWVDEESSLPLQYQFQYRVEGLSAVDGRGPAPAVVLAKFQPASRVASVTLPAGLDAFGNRITLELCGGGAFLS
jgi:hypothetical protein